MAGRLRMTLADKVFAISLLVLSVVLVVETPRWVLSHSTEIEIYAGHKLVGRYPLSKDRVIDVAGPLGITKVQIKNGSARIISSPCPRKRCMHMGSITNEGGMEVCVPNSVVVKAAGARSDGLDAVTK
jgi:hypothetical protein